MMLAGQKPERLGTTQNVLASKQAELSEVERKIREGDRYASEAAYLKEQVEKSQEEYANLAPARAEIEQVKAEAAAATAVKASADQDLEWLRSEAERLQAELDPARGERLRQELDDRRRKEGLANAQLTLLRAGRD